MWNSVILFRLWNILGVYTPSVADRRAEGGVNLSDLQSREIDPGGKRSQGVNQTWIPVTMFTCFVLQSEGLNIAVLYRVLLVPSSYPAAEIDISERVIMSFLSPFQQTSVHFRLVPHPFQSIIHHHSSFDATCSEPVAFPQFFNEYFSASCHRSFYLGGLGVTIVMQ